MAEVDWSGVRDRVAALASKQRARSIFGADDHRFLLNPVLTRAELLDVESAVGVRLPADYGSFLVEVGNGGAGPGFGIAAVVRRGDSWLWTGNDAAAVAKLGVEFAPFGPQVLADHQRARPAEDHFADHESYVAACRSWVQREDELYDEESYGTLAIAEQGCGHCWRLVVSGPYRGLVWDDARGSDMPLTPLTDRAGDRVGFGRWYLDWLAAAEAAAG